jgi:hypothetical protein
MPLQALPRAPQCISQPRTSRDCRVPPRSILLEGPIAHVIRELGEKPSLKFYARLCVLHAIGNRQQPTGNIQQAFASYHE